MFSFNYVNLCFTLFINMYMHLCRYLRITNFALFLPKGGISPIWDSPEIIDKSDRKPIHYSPGLNIRWSFGNKAFSYSPNASLIPNASLVSVLWWGKAKSHKSHLDDLLSSTLYCENIPKSLYTTITRNDFLREKNVGEVSKDSSNYGIYRKLNNRIIIR